MIILIILAWILIGFFGSAICAHVNDDSPWTQRDFVKLIGYSFLGPFMLLGYLAYLLFNVIEQSYHPNSYMMKFTRFMDKITFRSTKR